MLLEFEFMELNFSKNKDGLIPVIIQDSISKTVLMLGYMNDEAVRKTKKTGNVTFYSRTKKRLWTKGEESGNFLRLVNMKVDCDNDTILLKVKQEEGVACHTGRESCFFQILTEGKWIVDEVIIKNPSQMYNLDE